MAAAAPGNLEHNNSSITVTAHCLRLGTSSVPLHWLRIHLRCWMGLPTTLALVRGCCFLLNEAVMGNTAALDGVAVCTASKLCHWHSLDLVAWGTPTTHSSLQLALSLSIS